MWRPVCRSLLRSWNRLDRAPGCLYRAIEHYGPGLAASRPLRARLPNRCRIACDLRDHVQRQQWFLGAYEPVDSFLFTRLLRPGMTVIDAGANVGQYTLLAATEVGNHGSVHAFEPIPSNFERLSEAVAENALTNVHINRAALWHEAATLTFGRAESDADNAGSFRVDPRNGDALTARALRLDDYAAEAGFSRVDLIKMDIEGSEVHALSGALGLLEAHRPLLLLEVNREALDAAGSSVSALKQLLEPFGYRAWRIGAAARASGAVDLELIDRANVLLHDADLPPEITSDWDLRSALRWARRGW